MHKPQYSSASSQSTAYVTTEGAGGNSSSSATSPTGEPSNSQDANFVAGATSASASAEADASDQGTTTSAQVSVPAESRENTPDQTSEESGSASGASGSEATDADPPDANPSSSSVDSPQATLETDITILLGTPDADSLASTAHRDLFWGGNGADIFQLPSTGVTDLEQADVVLDYSNIHGDQLALADGLSPPDIAFEVVDLDNNGVADSTVIRSLIDNTLLGVVINTVDPTLDGAFQTSLSATDFIDTAAPETIDSETGEPSVVTHAHTHTDTTNISSSSASSSSGVDDTGAGSSSSATATNPIGETSTSHETVDTPGASSSSGSASAVASSEGVNTAAAADAPASNTAPLSEDSFLESETSALSHRVDFLIGTVNDDTLKGGDNRDFILGYGGADTFALSAMEQTAVQTDPQTVDILVDFSSAQGDQIQLPENINFIDITLEALDINGDDILDSSAIKDVNTGGIYAVVLNTVDALGNTTLLPGDFVMSPGQPTTGIA
ncbi:MAG: hypothetical protein AAFV72_06895 [Cyanobacteria bacterium J06635_1]